MNRLSTIDSLNRKLGTLDEDGSGNTLDTAEIYNPGTQAFTLTTDPSLGGTTMNVARKLHSATSYWLRAARGPIDPPRPAPMETEQAKFAPPSRSVRPVSLAKRPTRRPTRISRGPRTTAVRG